MARGSPYAISPPPRSAARFDTAMKPNPNHTASTEKHTAAPTARTRHPPPNGSRSSATNRVRRREASSEERQRPKEVCDDTVLGAHRDHGPTVDTPPAIRCNRHITTIIVAKADDTDRVASTCPDVKLPVEEHREVLETTMCITSETIRAARIRPGARRYERVGWGYRRRRIER